MAFKDRFSRMLRKSVSSGSSSGNDSVPAPTVDATPNSPQSPTGAAGSSELAKTPSSRLAKTLTWRSNKSSAAEQKEPKKKKKTKTPPLQPKAPTHPSERPLNEMNLRHQELLGAFSMSFGRSRRPSQGGRTSYSNVSPGGSRHASMDMSPYGPSHGHGHGDRRVSALAHEVEPEVPEEGSL